MGQRLLLLHESGPAGASDRRARRAISVGPHNRGVSALTPSGDDSQAVSGLTVLHTFGRAALEHIRECLPLLGK